MHTQAHKGSAQQTEAHDHSSAHMHALNTSSTRTKNKNMEQKKAANKQAHITRSASVNKHDKTLTTNRYSVHRSQVSHCKTLQWHSVSTSFLCHNVKKQPIHNYCTVLA
jgi:ribosomal protein L9